MSIIPETITPKELAEKTGWSERFVRETARALNGDYERDGSIISMDVEPVP